MRQPQPLLGVFALPQEDEGSPIASGVSLLLDRIQDPGNLGTIIRTADWFGIEHLYLAPGTADPFAPRSYRPLWAHSPASRSIA